MNTLKQPANTAATEPSDFPTFAPLPLATPEEVFQLRQLMGMTQKQLGKEMGVTEYSVWRWENDERPITKSHTRLLRMIADARYFNVQTKAEAGG